MGYVREQEVYNLPVGGEEFLVCADTDTIHHFEPLGAWVMRITVPEGMQEFHINEEAATNLNEKYHIGIVERPSISEEEYARIISWRSKQVDESGIIATLIESIEADKPHQGKLF
jgi:hypothetical protein